ncbi:hypothetical protein H310_10461 [Aphanomyces invadans]|uniref:Uncharacterized protein n=1 Tax=Aphanomyces invadans TaxID=157072 RepID=A0A024TRP1_9STRA|nr:hypothetical protein H310_10461 [Aphanomyces invadans]ETV96291.1 hypothetical protein H310_10461 [Aphanomyces invadans]|eukprot:XP_008875083.1 hypothetical protein H310_10461 [Aphanomyces invadans]
MASEGTIEDVKQEEERQDDEDSREEEKHHDTDQNASTRLGSMEEKSIPALRAQLDNVQTRYRKKEARLVNDLNCEYDYTIKHLDPIISEALEDLMLHRPEQVSAYLAFYMAGSVDVSMYKKTQLQPQAYFERKIQPALGLAMDSVIRDKPDDVKAYLTKFFEHRASIY